MSLSKNIYPSLVLVQPRKTSPFLNERLLMGRKESNQTKLNCRDRYFKFETACNRSVVDGHAPVFTYIILKRACLSKKLQ